MLILSSIVHDLEHYSKLLKIPTFRCIVSLSLISALCEVNLLVESKIINDKKKNQQKTTLKIIQAISKLCQYSQLHPTIIRNILGELGFYAGEDTPQGAFIGQLMISWEPVCAFYHSNENKDKTN